MVNNGSRDNPRLPPPLGVLLWYAANGLSVAADGPIRAQRPHTPEVSVWAGPFREFVESRAGLRKLKGLAETGMRALGAPPDYFLCLDSAFRYPSFRALAIAALQDYADTAREPYTLPEPPRHPPAADIRLRPERSEPKPKLGGPARPRRRPRRQRFEPK